MKLLFVTDLHGCKSKYDRLFDVAKKTKADIVVNAGDLLPNGSPAPIFQTDDDREYFMVTLKINSRAKAMAAEISPKRAGKSEGVSEGVKLLTEYIRKNPGHRVPSISRAINIAPKTLERWLRKLKSEGKIYFKGSAKTGGYWEVVHK